MIFFILIWSVCNLGFFALASAMSKHQKQIFNKTLSEQQTRILSGLGWLLLIIAMIICAYSGNLSNMLSYWVGVLTFSALFVGLCLSYIAEKIKIIALCNIALGLISGLIILI
ncbi:DUF3325 domain-containing protein [Acinetobacter sp. CFCC 10889]|uniref:DUF3325 domain-containing protein n=1 Tax=Acinetobacter sp. CFCC 10889 TaxID=1775557 RepID=UPI000DD0DC2F|nr:DUF3325 domain-containing protein [Acinetobacter sp. CFCC 10889]